MGKSGSRVDGKGVNGNGRTRTDDLTDVNRAIVWGRGGTQRAGIWGIRGDCETYSFA